MLSQRLMASVSKKIKWYYSGSVGESSASSFDVPIDFTAAGAGVKYILITGFCYRAAGGQVPSSITVPSGSATTYFASSFTTNVVSREIAIIGSSTATGSQNITINFPNALDEYWFFSWVGIEEPLSTAELAASSSSFSIETGSNGIAVIMSRRDSGAPFTFTGDLSGQTNVEAIGTPACRMGYKVGTTPSANTTFTTSSTTTSMVVSLW
jgi:hypothetical protein